MTSMEETRAMAASTAVAARADRVTGLAPMFDGFAKWGIALGDTYATLGNEWLTFVGQRMQEEMALPQKLASCTSPQDLVAAWADFFSTAAKDYEAEWRKLAEIGTASMRVPEGVAGGTSAKRSTN